MEDFGVTYKQPLRNTMKHKAKNIIDFYTCLDVVAPKGVERSEIVTTFKVVRDRYEDCKSIIFHPDHVFDDIMKVYNAYKKGEITYDAPSILVGKCAKVGK